MNQIDWNHFSVPFLVRSWSVPGMLEGKFPAFLVILLILRSLSCPVPGPFLIRSRCARRQVPGVPGYLRALSCPVPGPFLVRSRYARRHVPGVPGHLRSLFLSRSRHARRHVPGVPGHVRSLFLSRSRSVPSMLEGMFPAFLII